MSEAKRHFGTMQPRGLRSRAVAEVYGLEIIEFYAMHSHVFIDIDALLVSEKYTSVWSQIALIR